jgi:hypothetical protein
VSWSKLENIVLEIRLIKFLAVSEKEHKCERIAQPNVSSIRKLVRALASRQVFREGELWGYI